MKASKSFKTAYIWQLIIKFKTRLLSKNIYNEVHFETGLYIDKHLLSYLWCGN